MPDDSLQLDLIQFLARDSRVEGELDAGTELIDSGIIDSLMIVDLLAFVEQRFGVALRGGDVRPANLRTVACLATVIAEKQTAEQEAEQDAEKVRSDQPGA